MKFKYTETNVKHRDRQMITIIFAICELVAIFLFAYLGIARTSQVTNKNTNVITTEIDDYTHVRIGHRQHYYKIWIDGQKYHLGTALLTMDCDSFQDVLDDNPKLDIRIYHNDIVEIFLDDMELVSVDRFNKNQVGLRVIAIILFTLIELFTIAGYVLYMILHRTSKDKKWI